MRGDAMANEKQARGSGKEKDSFSEIRLVENETRHIETETSFKRTSLSATEVDYRNGTAIDFYAKT
jgi:hypothetical protein